MTDSHELPKLYALPFEAALEVTASRLSGLKSDEAQQRLGIHGFNRLPMVAPRGWLTRLLSQFHNVLIYVLIASAAVTAFMQHWIDSGVIVAVILGNAIVGFLQEGRVESAMDAIKDMLAPHAAVLRDGRRTSVDASELVPGDIVLVEAGDRVPADLRVIEARSLKVEEAALTGESVPVDKASDLVASDAALGDRSSMLFSGTLVAAGTGRGVVVATGMATEIGKISGMLQAVETMSTPLVRQMDVFARWLTLFILIVAALLLAYGLVVGHLAFPNCSSRLSGSRSLPSPRACRP